MPVIDFVNKRCGRAAGCGRTVQRLKASLAVIDRPGRSTPLARISDRAYRYSAAGVLEGKTMNDHVYKTIEITGTSRKDADDAIRLAIEKASQTLHNLRWFKVMETRGNIENGKIAHWQVTLNLGFTLE
jgi:dodecin